MAATKDDEESHHAEEAALERLRAMETLMRSSKVTLNIVLKRLQLKETEVANVYVYGSRVWGTGNKNSDWDFLIIHKNWPGEKSSVHNGEFDAQVYRYQVLECLTLLSLTQ